MSDLIKKLEAFRANLVGEDMNYRACLVDEGISHIRELEAALRGLHDDNVDYLRLNHLGGYDNHWLVAARKALGIAVETACESPKLMPCWCPYCGEPHSPAVRETKDG